MIFWLITTIAKGVRLLLLAEKRNARKLRLIIETQDQHSLQLQSIGLALAEILKFVKPETAIGFRIIANTEPQGGSEMPPTNIPPGGTINQPIPVGHRIVLTVEPLGDSGNPTVLDGELIVTTDLTDPVSVDASNPKSIKVRIDQPADRTLDTHVHMKDSADENPSTDITIDWDQSTVVENATGFRMAFDTEPQ